MKTWLFTFSNLSVGFRFLKASREEKVVESALVFFLCTYRNGDLTSLFEILLCLDVWLKLHVRHLTTCVHTHVTVTISKYLYRYYKLLLIKHFHLCYHHNNLGNSQTRYCFHSSHFLDEKLSSRNSEQLKQVHTSKTNILILWLQIPYFFTARIQHPGGLLKKPLSFWLLHFYRK